MIGKTTSPPQGFPEWEQRMPTQALLWALATAYARDQSEREGLFPKPLQPVRVVLLPSPVFLC